jgi:hypothetical protein
VLGNAVKFTAAGGVSFQPPCRRDMAVFEIETPARAFRPRLERIFEPFSRGAHTCRPAAPRRRAPGLGLTIAKMLTDLMGGEMTVEQPPGEGTLVPHPPLPARTFGAGRQRTAARGRRLRGRSAAHPGGRQRRGRPRPAAKRAEALGFEVLQAASGDELPGACCIAAFRPAPIFMDLAMPGIDGWETIRRMRSQR